MAKRKRIRIPIVPKQRRKTILDLLADALVEDVLRNAQHIENTVDKKKTSEKRSPQM